MLRKLSSPNTTATAISGFLAAYVIAQNAAILIPLGFLFIGIPVPEIIKNSSLMILSFSLFPGMIMVAYAVIVHYRDSPVELNSFLPSEVFVLMLPILNIELCIRYLYSYHTLPFAIEKSKQQIKDDAQEHIERGEKNEQEGKYENAIKAYQAAEGCINDWHVETSISGEIHTEPEIGFSELLSEIRKKREDAESKKETEELTERSIESNDVGDERLSEAEELVENGSYIEAAEALADSAMAYEKSLEASREVGEEELAEYAEGKLEVVDERMRESCLQSLSEVVEEKVTSGREELKNENYERAAESFEEADGIRDTVERLDESLGTDFLTEITEVRNLPPVLEELSGLRSKYEDTEEIEDIEKAVKERVLDASESGGLDTEKVGRAVVVSDRAMEMNEKYPSYPFDEVIDRMTESVEDGEPGLDVLKDELEVMEMVDDVLSFLETVDHSHPSVPASDWKDAVRTALETGAPEMLRPPVKRIDRMGKTLWEKDHLMVYSPEEFEHLVGTLFEDMGYEAAVTQKASDEGVDVWAQRNGESSAIQVKQFSEGNTVGRPTLQKISSTIAKNDADQAVVVTSSTFAGTAEDYARDFGSSMKLIDGDELVRLLSESDVLPPVGE